MFYSVHIEYFDRNIKEIRHEFLYDVEEIDKVLKDILHPYKFDGTIIINGRFLQKSEISKIQIVKSELRSEIIVQNDKKKMDPSLAVFSTKENTVFTPEYSIDITSDLFNELKD